MANAAVTNPPTESKTSRKKKGAKNENIQAASSARSRSPGADAAATVNSAEDLPNSGGGDGSLESPYLRELNKNIRNVKKKLNATQKVDSIVAENPNKSLDELLADRKINLDQKTQAQKKPALQQQLGQLEEQIAHYKQFDEDYQKQFATQKAALQSTHADELEKVQETTLATAAAETKKKAKEDLLVLSRFLRAAAAKRQEGDENADENRAFEGVLLLVYGGDANAVTVMEKLIEGAEDKVPAIDGTLLDITCKSAEYFRVLRIVLTRIDKQIHEASAEPATSAFTTEEAWVEEVAQAEPSAPVLEEPIAEDKPHEPASDPTVIHASLTEIEQETVQAPLTNGTSAHVETPTVPEASSIDAGAANAAGEANWETKMSASGTSGPEGWVEIPRDPAETDTGVEATPAAVTSTQSWAEDVPAEKVTAPAQAEAPPNDGFHEVHHNRGRGRGGGPGEFRGRPGGFRGNRGGDGGRGRGRGGYRGEGGGYRGRGGRGGGGGGGGPRGGRGGEGKAPPQ
ncbi:hypothetical protein MMC25_001002 [Agyrium rufum]|nr:hypothetical protein [Agyrium rufum]